MVSELEETLRRGRNSDGGWGYYPGKSSRLEPTCWSLLALKDADSDVLRTWPAADGLLLERAGGEPNYGFHGLGLLAIAARGIEHAAGNAALLTGIQQVKGEPLSESKINRQNNAIQAWSWIRGTFSWVEPTALCLLALKKWTRAAGARVDERRLRDAEALLVDRCCLEGGWNYGNANMLGQELPAYVPTTALALLALQDRRSEPAFTRSAAYLMREAESESSGVALALALLAMRVLGHSSGSVEASLVRQLPTSLSLGSHLAAALGLFALRSDHGYAAITL
jgi:hypothetical protein